MSYEMGRRSELLTVSQPNDNYDSSGTMISVFRLLSDVIYMIICYQPGYLSWLVILLYMFHQDVS